MLDNFFTALVSGGFAGLIVDIVLFPIDTIKTRLQSERGFWRSGGFKTVYKGLGPVVAASGPTSALFFCTYESIKYHFGELYPENKHCTYINMFAATIGEIVACSIRVPTEIAKQRRQVLQNDKINKSGIQILWNAYKTEGLRKGLYRGYGVTLLREIPFAFIQFPLWEFFKLNWCNVTGFEKLTSFSVAICGAAAGGIAAGITTPLDVAKTRIMLAERELGNSQKLRVSNVLMKIYKNKGIKGLCVGFIPRVMWITVGGAIYFGCYDLSTNMINENTTLFRSVY